VKKPSGKHHRRSVRLKGYDYSLPGMYFVTICVQGNASRLGRIVDGEMHLTNEGRVVEGFWKKVPGKYANVFIDCFVVMPNHVHAIVEIREQDDVADPGRGEVTSPQKGGGTPPLQKVTLGQIIGYYKYQTTKQINQLLNIQGTSFWQRNYYEHIIRNERALEAIRSYILSNPLNWEHDLENPKTAYLYMNS
jgi:REP element-mobilizing transposase RayT